MPGKSESDQERERGTDFLSKATDLSIAPRLLPACLLGLQLVVARRFDLPFTTGTYFRLKMKGLGFEKPSAIEADDEYFLRN